MNSSVTTYFNNRLSHQVIDKEFMYKLFQLLSFIRQLPYSWAFIGDQEYLLVSFKFTDFLEFTGVNKNHYQVQKVGKFLTSLQSLPPMLSTISNICFESVNIFPYMKVSNHLSSDYQGLIIHHFHFIFIISSKLFLRVKKDVM